jgi:hypothetical protein
MSQNIIIQSIINFNIQSIIDNIPNNLYIIDKKTGMTPLMFLCKRPSLFFIICILEDNLNDTYLNIVDNNNKNCLDYIFETPNTEKRNKIIYLLVKHGASSSIKNAIYTKIKNEIMKEQIEKKKFIINQLEHKCLF